ncbi:MAG TPA: hypothetical protein VK626_01805 [Nitrospiraceae bacterium]|nr:hypothetical protein [Nitrospiraceae bacterium]
MNIVPLLLQIGALFCLFCAAFNLFTAPPNKPAWGWLGMFLWLLSLMLTAQLHATSG